MITAPPCDLPRDVPGSYGTSAIFGTRHDFGSLASGGWWLDLRASRLRAPGAPSRHLACSGTASDRMAAADTGGTGCSSALRIDRVGPGVVAATVAARPPVIPESRPSSGRFRPIRAIVIPTGRARRTQVCEPFSANRPRSPSPRPPRPHDGVMTSCATTMLFDSDPNFSLSVSLSAVRREKLGLPE